MNPSVVRLLADGHPETGLQPCQFVNSANVTTGEAIETGHGFFTNQAGNVSAGVWKCTPYREEIESYPCDELMVILEGSVTLTDTEGKAETFTKGETVMVPKGFKGTWEITETLLKYYVIVE